MARYISHVPCAAVTEMSHTRVMWRRKATGVTAAVAGVVLFAAGLADHVFAAPKAALCQSGIGQFVQGLDGSVAHDCGLVTTLEAATGWLLIAGVLTAVFGAAVLCTARSAPGTARSAPGRDGGQAVTLGRGQPDR